MVIYLHFTNEEIKTQILMLSLELAQSWTVADPGLNSELPIPYSTLMDKVAHGHFSSLSQTPTFRKPRSSTSTAVLGGTQAPSTLNCKMCRGSWWPISKKCCNGEKHSQVCKALRVLQAGVAYFGVLCFAVRFCLALLRIHLLEIDYITKLPI